MKRLSLLLVLTAIGCIKPAEPNPAPTTPTPTAATNQTPGVGNMVMPGGPGGGVVTGDLGAPAVSPTASTEPAPAVNSDPKQSIAKVPAKLIDLAEAKKNPKMVVVSTKVTAEDPLTAAIQTYFSAGARAQMANFQNQYRISKEINDGKPLNYEQFMELATQLKIEFIPLPPWQLLGYDAKTGEIVMLEDKAVKIQHYKAINVEIEEGDKQYDTP